MTIRYIVLWIRFGSAGTLYLCRDQNRYGIASFDFSSSDDEDVPQLGKRLEVTDSAGNVRDALMQFVANDEIHLLTILSSAASSQQKQAALTLRKTNRRGEYRCWVGVWAEAEEVEEENTVGQAIAFLR